MKYGFITLCEQGDKRFYGGVLVLDDSGIPLEFRHSTLVAPTTVQYVMYGKQLIPHICKNIMSPALLNSLENSCDIMFTDMGEFMNDEIQLVGSVKHSVDFDVREPFERIKKAIEKLVK